MYTCVYAMYVRMLVCMFVCMYVWMHVCMYVCMYGATAWFGGCLTYVLWAVTFQPSLMHEGPANICALVCVHCKCVCVFYFYLSPVVGIQESGGGMPKLYFLRGRSGHSEWENSFLHHCCPRGKGELLGSSYRAAVSVW